MVQTRRTATVTERKKGEENNPRTHGSTTHSLPPSIIFPRKRFRKSTKHSRETPLLTSILMESTLLCASFRFVSSKHYDKPGAFGRNFGSSFSGKLLYKNSVFTRSDGAVSKSRAIVSSVLGRKVKKETIIPAPDYRIPIVLLGMAGGFVYVDNLAAAVPIGLLGLLLLVQTTRVRFVFDGEALEVKIGDELRDSSENAFVGGKNRWKYSTFVNWELWWPTFPILVYFKEIQTKPEGQIHFFPVIFNGKQLYDVMVERCGPSKTSGPK